MRFDNQELNAPAQYPAVNPQVIAIPHWNDADVNWSGLPPMQDAYLTVKRVVAYYDKPSKLATGTGVFRDSCNREKACLVVVRL